MRMLNLKGMVIFKIFYRIRIDCVTAAGGYKHNIVNSSFPIIPLEWYSRSKQAVS